MQYTIFTVLATAASLASAQSSNAIASASATSVGQIIPIGSNCVPNGTPCALGANCYAVNSMQQPVCGSFQATCTSDQQCAFNKCNGGFCNGPLLSSSASSAMPTITAASSSAAGFMPRPSSTVTATPGSLALGAECDPSAAQSQCAGGANCYSSNSGLIPRCGNFNAVCSSNAQCAYNACGGTLCNGPPFPSSSSGNGTVMASSTAGSMTASRSATGTGYMVPSRSASMPAEFSGAAAIATMVPELMAVAMGVAAFAL